MRFFLLDTADLPDLEDWKKTVTATSVSYTAINKGNAVLLITNVDYGIGEISKSDALLEIPEEMTVLKEAVIADNSI